MLLINLIHQPPLRPEVALMSPKVQAQGQAHLQSHQRGDLVVRCYGEIEERHLIRWKAVTFQT